MLSYFFPVSSLEKHNKTIRAAPGISNQMLPSCFALWRTTHSSHTCSSSCAYTAAIVLTTCISINPPIYNFNLLDSVKVSLEGGVCISSSTNNWFTGQTLKLIIQRPSTFQNEHNKLYLTEVSYDKHYIRLRNSNEKIPVFKLYDKCLILESRFMDLEKEYNASYQFTMKPGQILQFPLSPTELSDQVLEKTCLSSSVKIPQHIMNGYIDSLIQKKEVCPATLVELNRKTIHITPCGHPISTEGLIWITRSNSCPICRSNCRKEDLYTWKI